MKYGKSAGGIIVPKRMDARQRVTAGGKKQYLSREFHPDNEASYKRRAPAEFLGKMRLVDPGLAATWHPVMDLWQIWVRDEQMGTIEATQYCKGWRLLFTLRDAATGGYVDLDDRLFALLYHHDASRFGGAVGYYNELKRRQDIENDAVDKAKWHISQETGRGLYDHMRPSVGYGPHGDGNKVGRFG